MNKTSQLACTVWIVLGLVGGGWAADHDKVAFTDPAEAGVAFQLQGEYRGDIDSADGRETWGAQVIALGDDNLELVGYLGGLPGDGWKRGNISLRSSGQLADEAVVFQVTDSTATLRGGKIEIESEGRVLGTLRKVDRQSPAAGAKPPAGATVLFDGTSAEAFRNGKLVQGDLLGATDCFSKQRFGDHQLHLEFRTPFMPDARGQGRGNSGVYVQSRYELQVLDSFGLEGKDNECGGIYKVGGPAVNMCFPPLTWQTYDFDFTAARYDEQGNKTQNARITVRHNGVVIHDDLELPEHTPGRMQEGPQPAPLFMQDHGNPVAFRNIWVKEG